MKITFREADGVCYASSPQTEKRMDRRTLRFAQAGCSGFLLLRAPLGVEIDLRSEQIRKAFVAMGDSLPAGREESLPGLERITVRFVSRNELHRSNGSVTIRDEAAVHAICGVVQTDAEFCIVLPLEGMTYTTSVAVELQYTMRPHMAEVKKGLFKKVLEQTDFYMVTFERKPSYVDGMVYYTIAKSKYRYPVTEKMLGNTVLIKTNKEIPEFHSATPGVILKKK